MKCLMVDLTPILNVFTNEFLYFEVHMINYSGSKTEFLIVTILRQTKNKSIETIPPDNMSCVCLCITKPCWNLV